MRIQFRVQGIKGNQKLIPVLRLSTTHCTTPSSKIARFFLTASSIKLSCKTICRGSRTFWTTFVTLYWLTLLTDTQCVTIHISLRSCSEKLYETGGGSTTLWGNFAWRLSNCIETFVLLFLSSVWNTTTEWVFCIMFQTNRWHYNYTIIYDMCTLYVYIFQ